MHFPNVPNMYFFFLLNNTENEWALFLPPLGSLTQAPVAWNKLAELAEPRAHHLPAHGGVLYATFLEEPLPGVLFEACCWCKANLKTFLEVCFCTKNSHSCRPCSCSTRLEDITESQEPPAGLRRKLWSPWREGWNLCAARCPRMSSATSVEPCCCWKWGAGGLSRTPSCAGAAEVTALTPSYSCFAWRGRGHKLIGGMSQTNNRCFAALLLLS